MRFDRNQHRRVLKRLLMIAVLCLPKYALAQSAWIAAFDDASEAASPGSYFLPPVPPAEDDFQVDLRSPDDVVQATSPEPLLAQLRELQDRLNALETNDAKRARKEAEKKVSDAKKPTVKFSQELQVDAYNFGQDVGSKDAYGDIENGVGFRRARIALMGDYGPTEYRIEFDFAQSGRPTFLDVYGGLHDLPVLGRVRVGHYFEPFLLNRLTSNRYEIFMERSAVDQAFAPSRHTGISAENTIWGGRGFWALGYFATDADAYGDHVRDSTDGAITGRLTGLPYYQDNGRYLWHLGAAFSIRDTLDQEIRFRAQPEARVGNGVPNVPFFVDTGPIPANRYELYGLESAIVNGPFSVQAEYVLTPVHTFSSGTVYMHGWYAFASYFLTGENREYKQEGAIFDRVHPRRDFLRYAGQPDDKAVQFGPGAWEIAVRVTQLDFNDGVVHGGQLTDLSIGLNWYLTPYTRVTTNYIHAFGQSPGGIHSGTNIYGSRFQYEF
jgi:phosphate-selective porin OprO/OprP